MGAFKTMAMSTSPSPSRSTTSSRAMSPNLDVPVSPNLEIHMSPKWDIPMSPKLMSPKLDTDMNALAGVEVADLLGEDDDIGPPQIPQLPPARIRTPRRPRETPDGITPEKPNMLVPFRMRLFARPLDKLQGHGKDCKESGRAS